MSLRPWISTRHFVRSILHQPYHKLPLPLASQCHRLRFPSSCRTFLFRHPKPRSPHMYELLDTMKMRQLREDGKADAKVRVKMAAIGLVMTVLMTFLATRMVPLNKADAGQGPDGAARNLEKSKVIAVKGEEIVEEEKDLVETGTSTVPYFPRVLDFRDTEKDNLERYQLMGLGIRTVSFLGIQVYVVGMYIALDDIATLQRAMVKKVNPLASTLVAGEKGQLAKDLSDPVKSEEIWGSLLRDSDIRTILRIVPTRNTDFRHLRDAFVKHLTARAQGPFKEEYGDEAFGQAVNEFKQLFNRGSIPKGHELLISRDRNGKLAMWYDDGKNGAQRLGQVSDERISRSVWLNYLAGKSVASEGARQNIVQGVIEFSERPVGTVATQVL